ncbi:MAG: CRTAC1 family protein [Myxococcota bacterium]
MFASTWRTMTMRSPLRGIAATSVVLTTSCADPILPPDLGGEPFWIPVNVATGDDLGDPAERIPESEQAEAGPITLTDVSQSSGVRAFVAGGNSHGVGAAFADLDGDDWADIVVVNGASGVLATSFDSVHLRNLGDGTFAAAPESGIVSALAGIDAYSIATGDLDGDGDTDVYVGAQSHDILLRNRGDGTFEDATSETGAGGPESNAALVGDGKSKVVSLADFDNDGHLDIVSASSTLPAGAYLLRNLGDGTFEDISAASGVMIHPVGNPCAVLWSDYDTDGDRDLWIWNDRGGKVLLRNEGGETLTDVTAAAGLGAVDIGNPMGIDGADIDHDGDLDYYVSNIGNNPLLRNNGDGTFLNVTQDAGTGGQYGWGLAFEDFDADGWADIFVAQEDNRPDLVFRNRGVVPSRFDTIEVPHPAIADARAAHNVAVAFADYDHDGRVDVLRAGTDGSPITLYRNETDLGTHGWLEVFAAAPVADEPSGGIGARVVVSVDGELQFRDVTGGSSRASQNELSVRFGLGHFTGAEWVGVLWPSGRTSVVRGVPAGQRLQVP